MSENGLTFCGSCGDTICPDCGVCPWCVGHQDRPGDGEAES